MKTQSTRIKYHYIMVWQITGGWYCFITEHTNITNARKDWEETKNIFPDSCFALIGSSRKLKMGKTYR